MQLANKAVRIRSSLLCGICNRIPDMSSTKLAALVLIVVGGILLYFGYSASQSALESVSETVTGRFTDQTTLYLVGGAACAVVGVGLLLFGKR